MFMIWTRAGFPLVCLATGTGTGKLKREHAQFDIFALLGIFSCPFVPGKKLKTGKTGKPNDNQLNQFIFAKAAFSLFLNTLKEEILVERKFGGFGQNPPN